MATYSATWPSDNRYTLQLVTSESQSVTNNTTTVSWTLSILWSGSLTNGVWNLDGSDWYVNITGANTLKVSGSTVVDFRKYSSKVLGTGSHVIPHNADGTKTVTISFWDHLNYAKGDCSYSTTRTLPTIPRASTPTLNVSTQALGSAITISTNRASTSFTHTLTYAFGNQSGTIATGVATSQAWTLPASLASAIPNATGGTGTITCKTYNGSTLLGSKSVSFTATVPNTSTFQPTATISSIVEGASLPSGITAFVQNKSKAKVTSTGAGKYSATIKTYSVSVAGIGTYTGSVITSAFLQNSGSVRVTLTATDSRGLKGSTYVDIIVVAYSPPTISTFSASRSESTPANISVNFNASIASVSSQNYKYFRIRSKASDGLWVVKTDSTQDYTFSGTETIVSDSDKSYTIELFVQDSFTSITHTVQVGTAFTLLDFNDSGKGMAIGKVSESDSFEVALPTIISNPSVSTPNGITAVYKPSSNCNDLVEHWVLGSGTNYPDDGFWYINTILYSNIAKRKQIAYGYINNQIYTRYLYEGTWSEWTNILPEYGSNPNGSYVRFGDGTQICWLRATVTDQAIDIAYGAGLYIGIRKWTFPASFIETPTATLGDSRWSTGRSWGATNMASSISATFHIVDIASRATGTTFRFSAVAIGRWK